MSEFLPILIVLAVIIAAVFYLKKKDKKPEVTPEIRMSYEDAIKQMGNKPAPVIPQAVPDDLKLHPAWAAMGKTWVGLKLAGYDPTQPPPPDFGYSAPATQHEAQKVKGHLSPSNPEFDDILQNGVPYIITVEADKASTIGCVPKGGNTFNENAKITLTIRDKSGVVIDSMGTDSLQPRVRVQGPGGYIVEAVTSGYSGGFRFQIF